MAQASPSYKSRVSTLRSRARPAGKINLSNATLKIRGRAGCRDDNRNELAIIAGSLRDESG